MSRISLIRQGFFNHASKAASQPPTITFDDTFYLSQLRFEFSSLYSLSIANPSLMNSHHEMALYLDYLGQILVDYYTLDYVADELEMIRFKKKRIARFIENNFNSDPRHPGDENSMNQSPVSPWATLKKAASSTGNNLRSSARLRAYIARLIAARSYWNASRSLANHLIRFAVASGLSDEFLRFNHAFGVGCGVSEFLQALDQTQGVLRASSVVLNGMRLLINVSTLIKHLACAAGHESLSVKNVLKQEVEKRIYPLMDDLMWGCINFINNYRQFINVSATTAARLSLIGLAMDALLLMVSWLIDMKNYAERLQELKHRKQEKITAGEAAFIDRQIDILVDEWQVQCSYYLFNLAAAIMLCAVFSVSLMTLNPVLLGVLAVLSMIGNALYNSANAFKQYRQAATRLKREELNCQSGQETEQLTRLKESENNAFAVFFDSLLFNVVFTASLIAVAAVSLPLAGMMVVCYAGYKWGQAGEEKASDRQTPASDEFIYRISTTAAF